METKKEIKIRTEFKSKDIFHFLSEAKMPPRYFISTINGFKPTAELLVLDKFKTFFIKGWAVDIMAKDIADSVFVSFNEEKFFKLEYGIFTNGVGKTLGNKKLDNSGFEVRVPIDLIGKGIFKVSLWIVSNDKLSFYKTGKRLIYLK